MNKMFCPMLYQLAYFASISLTSLLRAVLGAIDHKGVLRGRCTLCSCVSYKEAKTSNKHAGCFCPTSVHVSKLHFFHCY